MLDVGDTDEHRLGRGRDPDRVRRQGAGDAPRDDRDLVLVLFAAHERFAEVLVDGWIGAAPGRAGQRDRARPLPITPHEQLGAGADERSGTPADGVNEAGREAGAEDLEHGAGIVRRRRGDLNLPGEHDLLEFAGLDPLDGAGDRLLVVRRRHRAVNDEMSGRRRVQQRQRLDPQLGQPPLDAVRPRPRPCRRPRASG